MRIALIYNEKNRESFSLLEQIAAMLESKGQQVMRPREAGYSIGALCSEDFKGCDAAIVFGGDGTMLSAARCLSRLNVPLFGVNMGRVGFLTSADKAGAKAAVERLLSGDYTVQRRMLIRCRVLRDARCIAEFSAFNDIVIHSERIRTINVALRIDGQYINDYDADGLIVATPTGSTGYSLSAGGPIVLDYMEMLLVTPVSPRSFFARPIVAAANSVVELGCNGTDDQPSLTADGQHCFSLRRGDRVMVERAPEQASIIGFGGVDLFDRIRNKLYR